MTFGFRYSSLFGFSYTLERSPDLLQWSEVVTGPAEMSPWADRTVRDNTVPAGSRFFWRLKSTSAP